MKINYSLFTDSQLNRIMLLTSRLKEVIRDAQPLDDNSGKAESYITTYEEYFTLSSIGLNAWSELHDREIIRQG